MSMPSLGSKLTTLRLPRSGCASILSGYSHVRLLSGAPMPTFFAAVPAYASAARGPPGAVRGPSRGHMHPASAERSRTPDHGRRSPLGAAMPDLLARTTRMRFFPDVANLPFRGPVMLAKAAASLPALQSCRNVGATSIRACSFRRCRRRGWRSPRRPSWRDRRRTGPRPRHRRGNIRSGPRILACRRERPGART